MKFVSCNDLHISERNPVSRTDNYQEAIFAKLDQVKKLAVAVKARAVLIAGDIFHEKTRVPYSLTCRFLNWCTSIRVLGIDVVAIPGNHDLKNDRYDSLSGHPLGLLFKTGIIRDVSYRCINYTTKLGNPDRGRRQ